MTLEERIEKAVKRIAYQTEWELMDGRYPAFEDWDFAALSSWRQQTARVLARHGLRAAFPELFTDPPTAWIAPMQPTAEMAAAMLPLENGPPTRRWHWVWAEMRDSHLSTLKGEKPQDG